MSTSVRRKADAFRRVSQAVGIVVSVPRTGGEAILPSRRRLVVAYGHEHPRSGGEAGFSVGIPNRLPMVDFILLLLGEADLLVPTEVFLNHWQDGSRSGDSRPTPILRRRADGGFYVQFGRDGVSEDLTVYVDAYDQLS
jgi:hypothetical protein